MSIKGMRVFVFGACILQIYYPTIVISKNEFSLLIHTALSIKPRCAGIQILGFGFGFGHFPNNGEL